MAKPRLESRGWEGSTGHWPVIHTQVPFKGAGLDKGETGLAASLDNGGEAHLATSLEGDRGGPSLAGLVHQGRQKTGGGGGGQARVVTLHIQNSLGGGEGTP